MEIIGLLLRLGEEPRALTLSFLDGIDAVRRVAEHAESKDHHPDIDIRWRTVTFALVTHSEGGITQNDVDMARDINGIVGS
ncbi:4a-hydroxytetrahydrobiopterin dehydratase [Mycobacterium avium]|uniref:4a-hydroxytetrahydrobiopterin dehydratase n=1 Tax=Mycobacterium avium TaxID=1764 RepID=UPI00096E6717|nr:4a-hydroxytetrahydrobiopterin dehydratase [Mycobacterium avium]